MEISVTQRSVWPVTIAIALAWLVAIMIGRHELYFETQILESGDIAVNALQIDDAKRGKELYGNYSRFQFNHPGPAFFYVYALGEIVLNDWMGVTPSPHNAHLLASLLLQILCFALAIALVHCWVDSWTFVALALLGGVWYFSHVRETFVSIWPPHVLLMPFLCFLAAAVSFSAGRARDLPILVIAGGFLFHGHVAQPLFVGGLGLAAVALHWRRLQRLGQWQGFSAWLGAHRGMAWVCGAWIALMLLPLTLDLLLYRGESNVMTIIRRFLVNTTEQKSLLQSLLYFLSFPTYARNQDELFTVMGPETWRFLRDHLLVLLGWLACVTGPAAFLWLRPGRRPEAAQRCLRNGYLLWLATVLLCVAWGLLQSGPMFQFNGFFYHGVYYFAALLGLGVICSAPGQFLPAPVTAALCCIACVASSWAFRATRWTNEEAGQTLQRSVGTALEAHSPDRPVLLVFEHYAWPESAAIALELQRRRIPFYTSPSWNFMFGRSHDLKILGPRLETEAAVWWVSRPGPGGHAISDDLQLFIQPAPVDPAGTKISFAGRANGYRYLVSGLSTGNVMHAWTDQQRMVLRFAALPASGDVQLVIDAHAQTRDGAPMTQTGEVLLNGQRIGSAVVSERNQVSLNIPQSVWNAHPLAWLELRFPDAASFRYFSRPATETWTAWGLWHLWFASAGQDARLMARNEVNPAAGALSYDGRIDFTAQGNVSRYDTSGLGTPAGAETPIVGNYANLVFRPEPTANDLLLQIVAHPYSEEGATSSQRCRIILNDETIFDAPFIGPGVARARISRDLWNRRPLAQLRIHLPDATPEPAAGQPRRGLAIRWLTVTPQPRL